MHASFYQGRSQAVATADANGAGLGETLVYTNSGPVDWMGVVVYNNSSTSATFYLDVDVEVGPPVDVYLIVDLTGSFADDIGCGRRNQGRISPVRQTHMLYLPISGADKLIAIDRLAAD